VTVEQKQAGYQAVSHTEDGQSAATNGDITQYVSVSSGQSQSLNFEYRRRGLIEGRVFSDLDGDGQRHEQDPGMPGIHVYLDETDNGQLDVGEPQQLTDQDGAYRFLHDFQPAPQPVAPRPVVAGSLRLLTNVGVSNIAGGVVTTTHIHSFTRGSVFQFQ